ncbi:MAG: ribosome maturation factor RimM [Flavobacteriaceae bacterium]|nr:ribosome maturation factor RimM [Flavobacteriaceae bacterium]
MEKQDCYYLGKIVSKFSFRGEVLLKLDSDESPSLKLKTIFIEIDKILVPFSIVKISLHKSSLLKIKFDGVDSENLADKILRRNTFLPLKDLPKLDGNKFYYHEIIGFKAEDLHKGEIGIIKEVNDQTSQPIVKINTNENKEVMIPLVDDFLIKLERNKKKIIFNLPQGLIDL